MPPTSDSLNEIVAVWYAAAFTIAIGTYTHTQTHLSHKELYRCRSFAHTHSTRWDTECTRHSYMIGGCVKLPYQLQVTWFIYISQGDGMAWTLKTQPNPTESTWIAHSRGRSKIGCVRAHLNQTTDTMANFSHARNNIFVCIIFDSYHHLDWRVKGYARHLIRSNMYLFLCIAERRVHDVPTINTFG